ncbi:hypothetical protein B0H13DRAFT_2375718 [Mycena leptocephala]|nr:hypothetical protein B0H13DRAFT_2375718 [Mycena leptocephala]
MQTEIIYFSPTEIRSADDPPLVRRRSAARPQTIRRSSADGLPLVRRQSAAHVQTIASKTSFLEKRVFVTPYKFDPHTIFAVLKLAADCIDRIPTFNFKLVDFELKLFAEYAFDAKNGIKFATVVFVAGRRDMRKALFDRVGDPGSGTLYGVDAPSYWAPAELWAYSIALARKRPIGSDGMSRPPTPNLLPPPHYTHIDPSTLLGHNPGVGLSALEYARPHLEVPTARCTPRIPNAGVRDDVCAHRQSPRALSPTKPDRRRLSTPACTSRSALLAAPHEALHPRPTASVFLPLLFLGFTRYPAASTAPARPYICIASHRASVRLSRAISIPTRAPPPPPIITSGSHSRSGSSSSTNAVKPAPPSHPPPRTPVPMDALSDDYAALCGVRAFAYFSDSFPSSSSSRLAALLSPPAHHFPAEMQGVPSDVDIDGEDGEWEECAYDYDEVPLSPLIASSPESGDISPSLDDLDKEEHVKEGEKWTFPPSPVPAPGPASSRCCMLGFSFAFAVFLLHITPPPVLTLPERAHPRAANPSALLALVGLHAGAGNPRAPFTLVGLHGGAANPRAPLALVVVHPVLHPLRPRTLLRLAEATVAPQTPALRSRWSSSTLSSIHSAHARSPASPMTFSFARRYFPKAKSPHPNASFKSPTFSKAPSVYPRVQDEVHRPPARPSTIPARPHLDHPRALWAPLNPTAGVWGRPPAPRPSPAPAAPLEARTPAFGMKSPPARTSTIPRAR